MEFLICLQSPTVLMDYLDEQSCRVVPGLGSMLFSVTVTPRLRLRTLSPFLEIHRGNPKARWTSARGIPPFGA